MANLKENPRLKDIQKYVQEGAQEIGFDKLKGSQRYLMLVEEVGELAKGIRKSEAIIVDTKTGSIEEELADVLLQTCAVANFFGIDLEEAFRKKQEKDIGRWK